MKLLIDAVIKVMNECKGVGKSLTVGTGKNSYQGVSDKDVKILISNAMVKHGLAIFPIDIEETTEFQQYTDSYGNNKNRFFTKVKVKYELCHVSGESKVVVGVGHGADALDKACGKAMTYALKTTLLYQFLVATGHIDDTDNNHSDENSSQPLSNGVNDVRVDPYAHGSVLVDQIGSAIVGIHKDSKSFGFPPSVEELSTLSLRDLIAEFYSYKTIEAESNYLKFVEKKLSDPNETWTADRLSKFKDKAISDKMFTDRVKNALSNKLLEVSQ